MQETPTTSASPTPIDRFRQWIRTLAGNLFAAPYLPLLLILFFITTAITHLAVVLMSQPLSYWHNPQNATGPGLFGETLSLGAGALIAAAIVYIVIGTLLLSFVHYRWSFIGWLIAEFSHFFLMQESLKSCAISRWSVLFNQMCQWVDYSFFWMIAALVIGTLLVFTFQPAEFSIENKKIQKGISYTAGVIPAVWMVVMLIGVILSAQKPAHGWTPVEVKDGPGPLRDSASAYDVQRNRLVMFGGSAGYLGNDKWDYKTDTWEWDGYQWINIASQEIPQVRSSHNMAYDEERGVTVLFGGVSNGEYLADTWEWDGKLWKRMDSFNGPSARMAHEMIYDPVSETVILYGGYDGVTFYNDAWAWDGESWERIELESGNPVASGSMLAYDLNQNYAFAFMNGSPGGSWRWGKNTWTRLYPEIEPGNRGWTTLVYDQKQKIFFMFGGSVHDVLLNDTWTYNGSTWKEFTSSGVKPSARANAVIWYDLVRERVMLFGGNDHDTTYNDTWEFLPPEE